MATVSAHLANTSDAMFIGSAGPGKLAETGVMEDVEGRGT